MSSISISKIENVLASTGFIPNKFFVMDDMCVYIEFINVHSAENMLLYIPSKYTIHVDNSRNVYKIKHVEIDENYDGVIDSDDKSEYEKIDVNRDLDGSIKPDDYNYPVKLDNNRDTKNVSDIFKQLRRIQGCVDDISYKIVITFNNYLCCITRTNSLICYKINTQFSKGYTFTVSTDLESVISKIDSLVDDIDIVRMSMYNVFDKVQSKHAVSLSNILGYKTDLLDQSEKISNEKKVFSRYMQTSKDMLEQIDNSEKDIIEKLSQLDKKTSNTVSTDIVKSRKSIKLEDKLQRISETKHEVIKNYIDIKMRNEFIALTVDDIMYKNSICSSLFTLKGSNRYSNKKASIRISKLFLNSSRPR